MLNRFTFLLLLAATSRALGGQASLGDVSINLPPPAGFCEMAATDPSDKRMLTIVGDLLTKSGNKLLSMSADCGQLASWRTARRKLLDDYAQYQMSLALIDKPPSETIKQTCDSPPRGREQDPLEGNAGLERRASRLLSKRSK